MLSNNWPAYLSRRSTEKIFYNLSCRLEDCIDNLHGFIMRVDMYHITQSTPAAVRGTEVLIDMGNELASTFELLKNIDKHQAELIYHGKLNKMETESDHTGQKCPVFSAEISASGCHPLERYDGVHRRNSG